METKLNASENYNKNINLKNFVQNVSVITIENNMEVSRKIKGRNII